MKRIFFLLLGLIVCADCATQVNYVSYTAQKFPPKPKYYFVTIYPDSKMPPSSEPYVVIGRIDVSGNVSDGLTADKLMDKAKVIARQKGADAIINSKTETVNYGGLYMIPGHVNYRPVFIGGGYYGRYHHHYGVGTVYAPEYYPTRYVPYSDTLITFQGELIVFLPRTESSP